MHDPDMTLDEHWSQVEDDLSLREPQSDNELAVYGTPKLPDGWGCSSDPTEEKP